MSDRIYVGTRKGLFTVQYNARAPTEGRLARRFSWVTTFRWVLQETGASLRGPGARNESRDDD
jgi:hypothetical protein